MSLRRHRWIVVPLELREPERPARWRCVGCGAVRDGEYPYGREYPYGDTEPCPAEELFA